jgi:hypothetical protein
MTVTFVTWALAAAARPPPAWALMIEANCEPSCSRLTRFATGVFGLKKAVQFAAIVFWSPATAVDEEDEDADGAAAADVGGELGVELLLPLLPQAAIPPPTAQASRIEETNLRVFTPTFSSFCHQ